MESLNAGNIQQRLREAYLAYRLNQHELVELVNLAEQGKDLARLEDRYTHFCAREVDWRQGSPERVERALEYLGLDQDFAALREDQVWTREQRALYRRLSQPQHDPGLDPAHQAAAGHPLLMEIVTGRFDEWDRNHDTRLTADELDRAMSLEQSPESAAALALLRRYRLALESIQPFDGSGMTLADLNAFAASGFPHNPSFTASINRTFEDYLQEASSMKTARALSEEKLDPAEIRQGTGGTCVMLSTLLGLSAEQVQAMVRSEAEGQFQLTFADGESEIVSDLTLAERLFHSRGVDQERWPGLLEMAMAQRLFREVRPKDGSLRSAIDGIEPEQAILAFTGKATQRFNLDEMTLQETRQLLKRITPSEEPILCGSRPDALGDFVSVEELYNGIANSHCYSIQGYDPERDVVILQNPWHKGEWAFHQDGKDDGRFEMPLRDYYCSYRWVAKPADGVGDHIHTASA